MSKEAMKLVPVEPTEEMLKAMDECSTEGYDERLYAGHAASVYMAAIDAAPAQSAQQKPVVWMYQDKSTHEVRFQKHMRDFVDHSKTSEVPLYSESLANHELQCVCGAVWCGDEMVHLPNKIPPQRKPLTDEKFLELILRTGTQELVGVATFVGGSIQMQGKIGLLRSTKIIKEFVEAAHGIRENT